MLRYYLLLILFLSVSYANSQEWKSTRIIDSVFYAGKIESLRKQVGCNKEIPSQYELSVYIALSYFPELDSVRIVFKESKIKTTLNARPTFWSLIFRKTENRKYIVRINSRKVDSLVTLDKVPFNARIGLFGHEFSHFVDYHHNNLFGVIGRFFSYSSKTKKETFEKEIDLITIKKGLGWQLYDWSYFVLNQSVATVDYKYFKKLVYLEPDEIKEIIFELN